MFPIYACVFQVVSSLQVSLTLILCEFLISPMRATFPALLIYIYDVSDWPTN